MKMKKLYKIVVFLLCAVFIVGACAPTGGNQNGNLVGQEVSAPGQLPIVEERITLDVFWMRSEYANITDIETNEFVLWLEEQTNIALNFTVANEEDADTALNLIFTGGTDIPDIILMELSPGQQLMFSEDNLLIPVNNLISEHGYFIHQMLLETGLSLDMITSNDGNIYAVPSVEECYHCKFSQKMWVNMTWLDTLGLDIPTTTDEFRDMLIAFRDQDPNGNGIADEVPLSGNIHWWHSQVGNFLMNAFVYYDNERWLSLSDDGIISASFMQPEWRDGLIFLKELFDEGLLDLQAFVQGPEQIRMLVEGDVIRLGAVPTGAPASFALDTGEATRHFATIPPIYGPAGFRTTGYYPPSLGMAAFITGASQHPVEAFKLLDFLLSEEATLRQIFGVEGVDWRRAEPGEVGLGGAEAIAKEINVLPGMMEQNQGVELNVAITQRIFNGRVDEGDPWYIEARLAYETMINYDIGVAPNQVVPPMFLPVEQARRVAEIEAVLNDFIPASMATFIVGERDIINGWDDYLAELRSIGVEEYIALLQAQFDLQFGR